MIRVRPTPIPSDSVELETVTNTLMGSMRRTVVRATMTYVPASDCLMAETARDIIKTEVVKQQYSVKCYKWQGHPTPFSII